MYNAANMYVNNSVKRGCRNRALCEAYLIKFYYGTAWHHNSGISSYAPGNNTTPSCFLTLPHGAEIFKLKITKLYQNYWGRLYEARIALSTG